MQNAVPLSNNNDTTHTPEMAMAFGPFVLHKTQKLLLQQYQPVRLGSRALELLIALVESPGQILSRAELEARVWPDTVVEETSLRVHISALRKVLGDRDGGQRYIENLPGRGYRFVMPVSMHPAAMNLRTDVVPVGDDFGHVSPSGNHRHNLSARLTRAIGRSGVTTALASQLVRRRLVSIVGPGGMGKTTVALAVARHCLDAYEHGVWFVDLAPLTDALLVPAALASVLNTSVPPSNPWPVLGAFLARSRMLIVLDNCEHVIKAAAELAEAVLRAAPEVHILATSREPLEAEGEWIHRLPALDMPTVADTLDINQALGFAAIELFVERASANAYGFSLSEANLPTIRQVCRQLDGMPLAIELAAARVESLGLQGLAKHLDNLFQLLTHGRRTAMPRHRTLQALIDWSHDLLTDTERTVLRRLAVFRGGFTLESAAQVCACGDVSGSAVIASVMGLCAQSLVVANGCSHANGHRMLYTTRTYAAEQLQTSGEESILKRRHAQYFCKLLQRASTERDTMPIADWLGQYGRVTDDVRAGLDWAFSPDGDVLIGVSLTAAAVCLVWELSLCDEYHARLDVALAQVRQLEVPQPALELQLRTASLLNGGQIGQSRLAAGSLERMLKLATESGSSRDMVELMQAMCGDAFGVGDYPAVAGLARRVAVLANEPSESMASVLSDRFLAMSQHYLGNHQEAWRLAARVLEYPVAYLRRRYVGWTPRSVSMGILRARISWLEGRTDAAKQLAAECVDQATGTNPHSVCQALATAAIPIALWRGDLKAAHALVDALHVEVSRHVLSFWQPWADSYRVILSVRTRQSGKCRLDLPPDWTAPSNPMALDMMGTHAEEMVTSLSLARVEGMRVGWNAAEILRAQGENLLRANSTERVETLAQVESLFERSLQIARQQGALSWELRTASSMARLWMEHCRKTEARQLLSAVYLRFTEGLDTVDLLSAQALLDELQTQCSAQKRTERA